MRAAYHEELDKLSTQLVEMTRMVRSGMSRATSALLDADLDMAEAVISKDTDVDRLFIEIETATFDLLARQQPVAKDLRTLVTSLRMAADLERMGDHAEHIANIARIRHPVSAVPPELRATILEMGQIAERLVTKAGSCIASRDVATALELESDDDAMDKLRRKLFTVLMAKDWEHGVEPAIDVTLAGLYYERYADHAVHLAKNVVYLVTGERVDEMDPGA